MNLTSAILIFAFVPGAANAADEGVPLAVTDHILPAFERFDGSADALADSARQDCTAQALQPAYHDAFDAWMGVQHISFGPMEDSGYGRAIAFWPDTKGATPATLNRLIADRDPVVEDTAAFATVSIAARGFFALDQMLFDPEMSAYGRDDYECALVQAIARDIARMADELNTAWHGPFADLMLSAGEAGNDRFLGTDEPARALLTATVAALEFDEEVRLGRPLGTFDRPRAMRAEARRSGRSLRNVVLSLKAIDSLATHLVPPEALPNAAPAFEAAYEAADALADDPVFAGVDDPAGRLKVEILQQRINGLRARLSGDLGEALGVSEGFNALDGD